MNRDIDFIPLYIGSIHSGSLAISERLSYHEYREKTPLWTMGSIKPISYTHGKTQKTLVVDILYMDGKHRQEQVFLVDQ